LARGLSPDARDRFGFPSFHRAIALDVKWLLAGAGADVHACDPAGHQIIAFSKRVSNPNPFTEGYYFLPRSLISLPQEDTPRSVIESKGRDILTAAIQSTPTFDDLFDAVSRHDAATVRTLLDRGAPAQLDGRTRDKPGLLFLAASSGAADIAQMLIQHGCNPNLGEGGAQIAGWFSNDGTYFCPAVPKDSTRTPIIVAAEKGDVTMVKLLLDAGAYVPAVDQYLRTAIDASATPQLAAFIKERSSVQFLADKFFSAPYRHLDYDALRSLLRKNPEAAAVRHSTGFTLYQRLTRLNENVPTDEKALAAFHDCGIKPIFLDFDGMTLLHRIVMNGKVAEAAQLMAAGFDPLLPDSRGITALALAQGILDDTERARMIAVLHGEGVTASLLDRQVPWDVPH